MSDVSVEYNAYLGEWMMIYACRNIALPGIYMTTALEPWGPWSAPQRIFDPDPGRTT